MGSQRIQLYSLSRDVVSMISTFITQAAKQQRYRDTITCPMMHHVPFFIGKLTEKVAEDDRTMVLKISKNHLKEFISICEALELVPEAELESSSQGGADTRATQRAKKRGAEAKLQEIKERKERRQQSLREAKLQRVDCLHPLKLGRKMYLMMMARRKERLLISCTC
ncbi:unnamed protein product [Musa acuminata var. zebrina]